MADQFDIQREMDDSAGRNVSEAMENLVDCRDKRAERDHRLIRLDQLHFSILCLGKSWRRDRMEGNTGTWGMGQT